MGASGSTHTVKQGDTLLTIAKQYKTWPWEEIWNHPENRSLRQSRKDPQVLAEGDKVFIPVVEGGPWAVETDLRHTFVLNAQQAWFRTEVLDDMGQPLVNQRFELKVGGESLSGVTSDAGIVELPIDPNPSASGELTVYLDGNPPREYTWHFQLGNLNPIEKISGIKARLINLGFPCGTIDETFDDETKKALRDFQIVYRLNVTGQLDDVTREKLLEAHDRR